MNSLTLLAPSFTPAALKDVPPQHHEVVKARNNKPCRDYVPKELTVRIADIVDKAGARMGQKQSDAGIFQVLVADLIQHLTQPKNSMTVEEVDIALRLGSQGKLPTTYRHLHSAAIFQWLKEYEETLRGPAAYAVLQAAKKSKQEMPILNDSNRTLLDFAIERVKEGKHFYASKELYEELTAQNKISLTTEEKWKMVDRAVEEEIQDCKMELMNTKSFVRETARNKLALLRAYDPVTRENKPEWIDASARFIAVREYIKTLL